MHHVKMGSPSERSGSAADSSRCGPGQQAGGNRFRTKGCVPSNRHILQRGRRTRLNYHRHRWMHHWQKSDTRTRYRTTRRVNCMVRRLRAHIHTGCIHASMLEPTHKELQSGESTPVKPGTIPNSYLLPDHPAVPLDRFQIGPALGQPHHPAQHNDMLIVLGIPPWDAHTFSLCHSSMLCSTCRRLSSTPPPTRRPKARPRESESPRPKTKRVGAASPTKLVSMHSPPCSCNQPHPAEPPPGVTTPFKWDFLTPVIITFKSSLHSNAESDFNVSSPALTFDSRFMPISHTPRQEWVAIPLLWLIICGPHFIPFSRRNVHSSECL